MSDAALFDDAPAEQADETFAAAAAKLTRQEMEFANGIVRGLTPAAAAKKAWPSKRKINGAEMLRQADIAHAVEIGKRELARALQRDTHYDIATAARDLEARIAAADLAGQHSAVSSLTALRLKLHGLLVERSEVQSAGFQMIVSGVDPSRMLGQARVVDAEIVEGE